MDNGPVEKKVSASTFAAALTTLVLYLLNRQWHLGVEVEGALQVLVPTVVTFAAGYITPHTFRTQGEVQS